VTGDWTRAESVNLTLETRRIIVPIPPRFTDMQATAPELARVWRATSRDLFQTYFARGFRVVDFYLDRGSGGGDYVLAVP